MLLIGMLDSPYVRRVAISLQLLGLNFEHRSISVFSTFSQFQQINPVVKAPTLVCDDGEILMDSSLILEYAEALAGPGKSLLPTNVSELQHSLCAIGLALAACEKAYRSFMSGTCGRPRSSMNPGSSACAVNSWRPSEHLRKDCSADRWLATVRIDQTGISVAVAWHFTQQMLPEIVPALNYPALREFSGNAETLPEFVAAPHGSGTYRRTQ